MFARNIAAPLACAGFLGIGYNRPLRFETPFLTALRGALGLLALIIGIGLFFTDPALAQAAATTVDFNPLVNQLTQVIVDTVTVLIGLLGLWLSMELKKKWNIDIDASVRSIEAMHRDTLHSAVETWTTAAVAKYGPNLKFEIGNPALAFILAGVAKSAPDAIKYLKASEDWIINKAAAVAGVTPVITPSAAAPVLQ